MHILPAASLLIKQGPEGEPRVNGTFELSQIGLLSGPPGTLLKFLVNSLQDSSLELYGNHCKIWEKSFEIEAGTEDLMEIATSSGSSDASAAASIVELRCLKSSKTRFILRFQLTSQSLTFLQAIWQKEPADLGRLQLNDDDDIYVKSSALLIPKPSVLNRSSSISTSPPGIDVNEELANPFISTRQELVTFPSLKPDFIARGLARKAEAYCSFDSDSSILLVTWNVAGILDPCETPLFLTETQKRDSSVIIIGLQEIDTSTEAYIYPTTSKSAAWTYTFTSALSGFTCTGTHQMVGLYVIVFERTPSIPPIFTHLATGLMGVVGNKGCISVHCWIKRSLIVATVCHFAADVEMVDRRNGEWRDAMKVKVGNGGREFWWRFPYISPPLVEGEGVGVAQADYLFFLGDFNYRIDAGRPRLVKALEDKENIGGILEKWDQLVREKRDGKVFTGFLEAPITFPPTYKYDQGTSVFDTSEKQRCPAWCDRILWRDDNGVENVSYNSFMEQLESDHKPVAALFKVKTRTLNMEKMEAERNKLLRVLDGFENDATPRISITPSKTSFESVSCFHPNQKRLVITNVGKVWARVTVEHELDWISVSPPSSFLFPGERMDVIVTAKIPSENVKALNRGEDRLEGIIVFQVENGQDVFLEIDGVWRPSAFGEEMGVLGLIDGPLTKDSILKAQDDLKKGTAGVTVPKQLSKMLDFIYLHGKPLQGLFTKPGNGLVIQYMIRCIDIQEDFDTEILFANLEKTLASASTDLTTTSVELLQERLASNTPIKPLSLLSMGKDIAVHSCIQALSYFLKTLPQPVVPLEAQDRCVTEGYLSSIAARQVVSQTFRKREIGVFMYICMFMKDMVGGGRDISGLCRFFSPLMFQKDGAQTVGGYFLELSFGGGDISTRRAMFIQRFLEG